MQLQCRQTHSSRDPLDRTFIALVLLACVKHALNSYVECPAWTGARYANGKCFKLFEDKERTWGESLTFCPTQHSSRLAEPRTLEEVRVLMAPDFIKSQANVGALMMGDSIARFVSDESVMEMFGYGFEDYRWSLVGYIKIQKNQFVNAIMFDQKKGRFALCEIQLEVYYIPQSVASPGLFPQVLLEILPLEGNPEQHLTWNVYHHSNTIPHRSEIVFTKITDETLTTNRLDALFEDTAMNYSSYVIELIAPQWVTVTLVYEKDDSIYFRSLLHPFIADSTDDADGDDGDDGGLYYYIVMSSQVPVYFMLSIVSNDKGDNHIRILFPHGDVPYNYIWMDSFKAEYPSSLALTLSQNQSANIRGMMNLGGGTIVTASRTLTVFVTLYTQAPSDEDRDNSPPLDIYSVYQALPGRAASDTYVTIPMTSSRTANTTSYTAIAVYPATTVKINDDVYILPWMGFAQEISLPSKPYMVTADKPFVLYQSPSVEHRRYDACLFTVVPEIMWRTRYRLSENLMGKVTYLMLHLVFERESTLSRDHQWASFLGADQPDTTFGLEQCDDVAGGDKDLTVCSWRLVTPTSRGMDIGPTPSHLRFAAYILWLSKDGLYHCQPLGIDWSREWRHEPPAPTTTTASTTTTATENSTTTEEAVPPPSSSSSTTTTTTTTTTTEPPLTTTQISTEAIPPTTSEPPPDIPDPPPTLNLTMCRQNILDSIRTNLSVKEVQNVLQSIKKELYLDTTKTSSFVRSKTSAKDERKSSTGMGYIGIVIMALTFGSIILSDVITLACRVFEAKDKIEST